MFLRTFEAVKAAVLRWRRRNRTRDDFPGGASLSEIHRFGIRYTSETGRYVDIGYEATIEGHAIWLVHEASFECWDMPAGEPIGENERRNIAARLEAYCRARERPVRFVA